MIEEPTCYPWLTGRRNLEVQALAGPDSIQRALDRVGLTGVADRKVKGYGTTVFLSSHQLAEVEREVLDLVVRGRSNTEIARILCVSVSTVKTHVTHVLDKLGMRDRVSAVVYGYEHGLVAPGDGKSG